MATRTSTETLRDTALKHLWMHNRDWVRQGEEGEPLIIVDGKGVRVTDSDGRSWIDVNGGYYSVNVGYGRTEIANAAHRQMIRMPFFPWGTATEPTVKLAEKLADIAPGSLSRVFPVSGGSEANETALKLVRAYHVRNGEPGRYKVISREGSYHGATLSLVGLGSSSRDMRDDYEPMDPMYNPGMLYAPQPNAYRCERGGQTASECAVRCAEAIEELILRESPETVAAVFAEPVANPSGAAVPGDEYWPMLREICDKYGVLLVDDEVICGFGRTGKMFGIEHWGVVPDILTVAKGMISSYLPLGAVIATEEVADRFAGGDRYFRHGISFGGHPVAAAASLKNIEILEDDGLLDNAANVGAYFKEQLRGLMNDHSIVGDVRGIGLLLAVELVTDRETKAGFAPDFGLADRLNEKFRRQGLIFYAYGAVLPIGPPLCITRSEVDEIVSGLDSILWELEGELKAVGA